MKRLPRDSRGLVGVVLAIIVIVIIIIVVIAFLALLFIPINDVPVNESQQSSLEGVSALDVRLNVDRGDVNVVFVDNNSTASLTVTGHQRSGILGSAKPVNVTWQASMSAGTLIVNASITSPSLTFPFSFSSMNCTLKIPNKLPTALALNNSFGAINLDAGSGVNLTSLNLKASTGGVRATLTNNATLSGPLHMEASTGGVDLIWTDVKVSGNTPISLTTSTGGIRATMTQSDPLNQNVSVTASASVGGINFGMNLKGNNSAHVTSHTSVGGVNLQEQTGFNGTKNNIASQNYPSDSNFEVALDTSTGGINLSLRYQS